MPSLQSGLDKRLSEYDQRPNLNFGYTLSIAVGTLLPGEGFRVCVGGGSYCSPLQQLSGGMMGILIWYFLLCRPLNPEIYLWPTLLTRVFFLSLSALPGECQNWLHYLERSPSWWITRTKVILPAQGILAYGSVFFFTSVRTLSFYSFILLQNTL